MAKEVRLPQLGQTMEEGTIVNCLVKLGDQINKGDVIFEIETDKATLEMESELRKGQCSRIVHADRTRCFFKCTCRCTGNGHAQRCRNWH